MDNQQINVNRFPAWQTALRQAQAEMVRRQAAEQAQREAREAERQRLLGADLAKALANFGIQVDAPDTNRIELDGFIFKIGDAGYDLYPYRDTNAKWVRFDLIIYAQPPVEIDSDSWGGAYRALVFNHPQAGDWQTEQAALAETLDYVLERYNDLLRRLSAAQVAPTKPDPTPTTDQQLADLIRAIVREELDGRNG